MIWFLCFHIFSRFQFPSASFLHFHTRPLSLSLSYHYQDLIFLSSNLPLPALERYKDQCHWVLHKEFANSQSREHICFAGQRFCPTCRRELGNGSQQNEKKVKDRKISNIAMRGYFKWWWMCRMEASNEMNALQARIASSQSQIHAHKEVQREPLISCLGMKFRIHHRRCYMNIQ
jgi:hypothetical protein